MNKETIFNDGIKPYKMKCNNCGEEDDYDLMYDQNVDEYIPICNKCQHGDWTKGELDE